MSEAHASPSEPTASASRSEARAARVGAALFVLAWLLASVSASPARAEHPANKVGGAGELPATSTPSGPKPPKGTIVVPAAVVARAIDKRDVGATDATAPDGSALGARLRGVGRYKAGLRDGDVVVTVEGTRTETTAAMVGVGMRAVASGATRLSGTIRRGEETWRVVLELPQR